MKPNPTPEGETMEAMNNPDIPEQAEPMTMEQFRGWMKLLNTQMLEFILLQGDAHKPKWFTAELTAEIQQRRAAKR